MSNPLIPHLARLLTSERLIRFQRARHERRRQRRQDPHRVTVYLNITDPHSYLLLQVLQNFQERFDIEYDFRTVLRLQPDMFPAIDCWHRNAFKDGQHLAQLYDLDFPEQAPESDLQRDTEVTAQLLHWELQLGYLQQALAVFRAYWQGDQDSLAQQLNPVVCQHTDCYSQHLANNEQRLKDNGHYLSGMLHYGGEWYWGLNRLQYLEQRFNELGLALSESGSEEVRYERAKQQFCRLMSPDEIRETRAKQPQQGTSGDAITVEPITAYWSIRSPYSYLGLVRLRELAKYYQVPLVVKPVLPMLMRRMQVPKNKSDYILMDVKREASQQGIDFGFIADPLGAGVERCYALYEYAQEQGKALDYLESYARGVWAQGIRSDTDSGLQKLVERAGLDWSVVKTRLDDGSWRVWAQENLLELYDTNLWGVPSIRYGDVAVFGQDRIDCIEAAIVANLSQ